jgi:hypothetical protein
MALFCFFYLLDETWEHVFLLAFFSFTYQAVMINQGGCKDLQSSDWKDKRSCQREHSGDATKAEMYINMFRE